MSISTGGVCSICGMTIPVGVIHYCGGAVPLSNLPYPIQSWPLPWVCPVCGGGVAGGVTRCPCKPFPSLTYGAAASPDAEASR
jgi:hypothetical protein